LSSGHYLGEAGTLSGRAGDPIWLYQGGSGPVYGGSEVKVGLYNRCGSHVLAIIDIDHRKKHNVSQAFIAAGGAKRARGAAAALPPCAPRE